MRLLNYLTLAIVLSSCQKQVFVWTLNDVILIAMVCFLFFLVLLNKAIEWFEKFKK